VAHYIKPEYITLILNLMNKKYSTDVHLVLFFKSPDNAKSRLALEIGKCASEVAKLLWECTLEDLNDWHGQIWFSPANLGDRLWLDSQVRQPMKVVSQGNGNLGERINHVDKILRSQNVKKIIYIGMDCPGLNPNYLRKAADELQQSDVVLGPSLDGGVVLMGAQHAWPDLCNLPWSTSRLCDELKNTCKKSKRTFKQLHTLYDIDSKRDLLYAQKDLASISRITRQNLFNWIKDNLKDFQDSTSNNTEGFTN
tara:strand:+ start:10886 stop:11644 length:759 start_codon:yes stop_codon:yes gene_type:complete